MALDMSVDLIQATVQLEQPLGDGTRTVGTGFLISDPTPDGRPRMVLVTANHVFKRMPGDKATIGYRVQGADGSWRYAPQTLTIRSGGRELWTHHGSRDVAAITITAPPAFAKAAIPLNWLAGDDTFNRYQLGPGDEMMALGFPQGLSANRAGFPILRSGRVASYPLTPSSAFPTFLLDFSRLPRQLRRAGLPRRRPAPARRSAGRTGGSVHRRHADPAGRTQQREPRDRHRHPGPLHPRNRGHARRGLRRPDRRHQSLGVRALAPYFRPPTPKL